MPVKIRAQITSANRSKFQTQLTANVLGSTTAMGQRMADDLANKLRDNLQAGGGTTALSEAGANRVVRKSYGYPHVATGATLRSIAVSPVRKGAYSRRWTVSIAGAARVLDRGQPAGLLVPETEIMQWLAVRGLDQGRTPAQLQRYAKNIAEQIQRNGLAATYFYRDAVSFVQSRMRRRYYG